MRVAVIAADFRAHDFEVADDVVHRPLGGVRVAELFEGDEIDDALLSLLGVEAEGGAVDGVRVFEVELVHHRDAGDEEIGVGVDDVFVGVAQAVADVATEVGGHGLVRMRGVVGAHFTDVVAHLFGPGGRLGETGHGLHSDALESERAGAAGEFLQVAQVDGGAGGFLRGGLVAVNRAGVGADVVRADERPDLKQAVETLARGALHARVADEEAAEFAMRGEDGLDAQAACFGLGAEVGEV